MFNPVLKNRKKKLAVLLSIVATSLSFTNTANATIVEFQTSQGSFQVNLFDQTTPATVANFLEYTDSLHYSNSIIHRVVPNFVVQGGGFEFNGSLPLSAIGSGSPVINEAIYSNVEGTIAMAKLGGNANSATDQWFFNLADNSNNLDRQNGGFTVFGQVIGDGMVVVNKIAQLKLCSDIPVAIDTDKTCADLTAPGLENFVVIEQVVVVDSSEVTDSDLTPVPTKYPDTDGDGVLDIDDAFPNDPTKSVAESNDDSGGSMTWFTMSLLGLMAMRKRFSKR